MSSLFVSIPSEQVHSKYQRTGEYGDTVVDIVQATSGEGYAVFVDTTLVYVTEEFDCLTEWIMKDLGLVD